MASKTSRTETRRKHKKAAQGTKRKAALRTKGSTKSAKKLFGDWFLIFQIFIWFNKKAYKILYAFLFYSWINSMSLT